MFYVLKRLAPWAAIMFAGSIAMNVTGCAKANRVGVQGADSSQDQSKAEAGISSEALNRAASQLHLRLAPMSRLEAGRPEFMYSFQNLQLVEPKGSEPAHFSGPIPLRYNSDIDPKAWDPKKIFPEFLVMEGEGLASPIQDVCYRVGTDDKCQEVKRYVSATGKEQWYVPITNVTGGDATSIKSLAARHVFFELKLKNGSRSVFELLIDLRVPTPIAQIGQERVFPDPYYDKNYLGYMNQATSSAVPIMLETYGNPTTRPITVWFNTYQPGNEPKHIVLMSAIELPNYKNIRTSRYDYPSPQGTDQTTWASKAELYVSMFNIRRSGRSVAPTRIPDNGIFRLDLNPGEYVGVDWLASVKPGVGRCVLPPAENYSFPYYERTDYGLEIPRQAQFTRSWRITGARIVGDLFYSQVVTEGDLTEKQVKELTQSMIAAPVTAHAIGKPGLGDEMSLGQGPSPWCPQGIY